MTQSVGLIINPASGRDIRRLTAHASVFPTAEKANMAVRLLSGLGALGIQDVLSLRDNTGIAALLLRAIQTHEALAPGEPWPAVHFLDLPITDSVADTHAGVAYMLSQGVSLIAVLGGDGTHRAVAAHCANTPILALSTGTNNAFPQMLESTVAGLAAALYVREKVPASVALSPNKRLVARCTSGPNMGRQEMALVDVASSRQPFIGARAITDSQDVETLLLSFAPHDGIGLSCIGGAWHSVSRQAPHGLHMELAPFGTPGCKPLMAPIAPGRIKKLALRRCLILEPSMPVQVQECGTLAFDGEREIELAQGDRYSITLDHQGPLTLDVARTMAYASEHRLLAL